MICKVFQEFKWLMKKCQKLINQPNMKIIMTKIMSQKLWKFLKSMNHSVKREINQ